MPTTDRTNRIAIVGVGGVFPGAPDLDAFWRNIADAVDSGRHAPTERWYLDPKIAYDAEGPKNDRVYSTWECFIEHFQFDPSGLNLDRELLKRLDPLFWIGLHASNAALLDSGIVGRTNLDRVGVILGNIALPTESTSAMCRDVLGKTFVEKLIQSIPNTAPRRDQLVNRLLEGESQFQWHPSNRLAASLPAALIAQGLNLGGTAFTLDAACASSLYALKFACEELRSYRADAMLAGGMSRPDCQYTQMGFAQLKALSKRGRCSPLSADADGLVVGEGAGVFVLKRLNDAIADGNRIYGVIAGIGLSNDRGANLLAPHSDGQLRAMRMAYEEAGWSPSDVDLIECHATGTPVGDSVEISSLHQLWQAEQFRPGQCIVGGVKSNVGHLLTGAGAAGLMKVLLALEHQTLPPTANHVNAHPAFEPARSPFRVLSQAEPWPRRQNGQPARSEASSDAADLPIPRRATVNAFGFGGINAHVLIEEYLPTLKLDLPPGITTTSRYDGRSTNSVAAFPTVKCDQSLDIAIVGLAFQMGEEEPFPQENPDPVAGIALPCNGLTDDWGVEQSEWFRQEFETQGYSADQRMTPLRSISIPLGEFRIPPLEMQDMLPQQQLMLRVAWEALCDVTTNTSLDATQQAHAHKDSSNESLQNRTGVFIGIELDPNTTNFHLRWSVEQDAPRWAEMLKLDFSPAELADWIGQLKDAAGVPLTANRVMGNLGGIVASRLAREFNVGGPSFTISSAENSGLRACELAASALRRGELDRAVVGAVDLPCDIRNRVALLRSGTAQTPLADAATAIVLKRLEDAVRDGDRIHAVIRRIDAHANNDVVCSAPPPFSAGAATGLLNLALTAKAITQRASPNWHYWLVNRTDDLRRMCVEGFGDDGRNLSIELTEPPRTDIREPSPALVSQFKIFEQKKMLFGLKAAIFVIDGISRAEIQSGLEQLAQLLFSSSATRSNHEYAKEWFQRHPPCVEHEFAMTLVSRSLGDLPDLIESAFAYLNDSSAINPIDRRIHFTKRSLGRQGRMAFVFPGSGNAFLRMGRDLLLVFPDILLQQEAENANLRDQYRPDIFWSGNSSAALFEDHKAMIFGQVALGTAICDLLDRFGIRPSASIGYSLGESAALFGLRAWTDRDEMLQRMHDAALFGSDLVRPFNAARKAWNLPHNVEVDWITGAIDRSSEQVRTAISAASLSKESEIPKVYLLIVNTPSQCVIGGLRENVERLVQSLDATFVPFSAPSTVHCEILRQVEPAYRALHLMRTIQPRICGSSNLNQSVNESITNDSATTYPIDFYSTAWGHAYELTSESAADAIVAQAVSTIDFPKVIKRAYEDGVRLFVEIGPGSSCTKMIDEILGDRPHFAESATPITSDSVGAFFELLAMLIAERVPVDLSYLYGNAHEASHPKQVADSRRTIVTKTGATPFSIPTPENGWKFHIDLNENHTIEQADDDTIVDFVTPPPDPSSPSTPLPVLETPDRNSFDSFGISVINQLQEIIEARIKAHTAYLQVSAEIQRVAAQQLFLLSKLAREMPDASPAPIQAELPTEVSTEPPRSLNRNQCMEFAIGKIGRALGPKFAEIDKHPTRVRLPDEPLMLVDRIVEIDGEPLSMTSGRVVTEHDIHPGAWYLDGNRIPTCIAVEAGQADLFLSGWLGIDFETGGLASYRLLDAVVTFHRELPQPGQFIHYDIRINNFFRQGQTYLFRFEFDATVNGQPLLTMREGCAGFFTEAELASGKGIVHTALDRKPRPGIRPADWRELIPMSVESYDDAQLLALRQGNLKQCFGPEFSGLPLHQPMTIPGLATAAESTATSAANSADKNLRTRMWLVDRILKLDPTAGKFGLGTILGELDIQPDDWFLTCHFCDDQVMPGTLMYECCLHTLRVYLLRMGWVGEAGQVVYEPIPGIRSRLKCRGQVRANTKKVWYEIILKEIGYSRDEANFGTPFCIADALMYADGKPIVEITDMSVRLNGLTREAIESLWNNRRVPTTTSASTTTKNSSRSIRYDRRPALFDTDRITAFAIGKPSDAFGDRYRVFDSERIIARLPGPPFQFLDRVVSIRNCQPWVLQAGGEIVAQYDIPADAWYFVANRQQRMPFSVL